MNHEKMLEACVGEEERHLHQPFQAGEHVVATDGCVLVATPGTTDSEPPWKPPRYEDLQARVSGWLSESPEGGVTFDLDTLRSALPDGRPPCEVCNGTGGGIVCFDCEGTKRAACECDMCGHRHKTDCSSCDSGGIMETCYVCRGAGVQRRRPDTVVWTFKHHILNAAQLARVLQHAPGETVTIYPGRHAEDRMYLIGEGWRGLVMPLRDLYRNDEKCEIVGALEEHAMVAL